MIDRALESKILLSVRILAVAIITIGITRIAWMSDDSLITLRSTLNITHGWGPGFNATERVEAYTHPLWFLVWTLIGVTTNQWVLGIIVVSIVFTAIAVGLMVWSTRSIARIIAMTGLLLFSNAFMEFATGGLENPLGYLVIGLLITFTQKIKASNSWSVLFGLTIAAAILTRFDFIFLVAPAVVFIAMQLWNKWRILGIAAASAVVPLLVWFIWSKLTYDSFLPNTYEAKRNLNIPATELAVEGFRYLWVSFEHDPVTFIALLGGVTAGLIFGTKIARIWALGVVLYVGYVVSIGGDFMAGRFLAVPVFVAVFVIALLPKFYAKDEQAHGNSPMAIALAIGFVFALVVGSSYAGSTPTVLANGDKERWPVDQNFNAGIGDARGSSVSQGMGLKGLVDRLSLAYVHPDVSALGDGSGLGRELREVSKAAQNWPVNDGSFTLPSEVGTFCGYLGNLGIATGPTVHLVDYCALTDRYLAGKQFTPASPFAWKAGHFDRVVPDGYLDAIRANDPSKVRDPFEAMQLKELWSRIRG